MDSAPEDGVEMRLIGRSAAEPNLNGQNQSGTNPGRSPLDMN